MNAFELIGAGPPGGGPKLPMTLPKLAFLSSAFIFSNLRPDGLGAYYLTSGFSGSSVTSNSATLAIKAFELIFTISFFGSSFGGMSFV
jgi:hypothetical protein